MDNNFGKDITDLVSTRIDSIVGGSILIYLVDETGTSIGFLSKSGFSPMIGTEKKYRLVPTETLASRPGFSTWFKVFRKEVANG